LVIFLRPSNLVIFLFIFLIIFICPRMGLEKE